MENENKTFSEEERKQIEFDEVMASIKQGLVDDMEEANQIFRRPSAHLMGLSMTE